MRKPTGARIDEILIDKLKEKARIKKLTYEDLVNQILWDNIEADKKRKTNKKKIK